MQFLSIFIAPIEKTKSEANWPRGFWMTTFADADYKKIMPSTFQNISGLSDNIARELNGLISPLFFDGATHN